MRTVTSAFTILTFSVTGRRRGPRGAGHLDVTDLDTLAREVVRQRRIVTDLMARLPTD
jgi:hypothetical protein